MLWIFLNFPDLFGWSLGLYLKKRMDGLLVDFGFWTKLRFGWAPSLYCAETRISFQPILYWGSNGLWPILLDWTEAQVDSSLYFWTYLALNWKILETSPWIGGFESTILDWWIWVDSISSGFGLNGLSLEWTSLEKIPLFFFFFSERIGLDGTYLLKKTTFILENLGLCLYYKFFFLKTSFSCFISFFFLSFFNV